MNAEELIHRLEKEMLDLPVYFEEEFQVTKVTGMDYLRDPDDEVCGIVLF